MMNHNWNQIDDFVNAELEESDLELPNYKDHLKKFFQNKPLNVDTLEPKREKSPEEIEMVSNKATLSKQNLDKNTAELDGFDSKNAMNTNKEKDLLDHFGDDFDNLKFPGTAPDLEPELQKYGQILTDYRQAPEDMFIDQENEIGILPKDFTDMLDGNKDKDVEKVVYFSTLNSQDKVDHIDASEDHSQPKTK